ncbi:hypothetical protein CALCODRAFT_559202 [Calocera cornea HHB12733]|uniref:Uncharacterized protein n=1 Tax=Calocera cornea HHB12733 TaxID=1353952 RepID=A0A165C4V1_9BASI|nr:hypothetical protein CALCODRAFT_559202 [Calocera cornea HHB12733]
MSQMDLPLQAAILSRLASRHIPALVKHVLCSSSSLPRDVQMWSDARLMTLELIGRLQPQYLISYMRSYPELALGAARKLLHRLRNSFEQHRDYLRTLPIVTDEEVSGLPYHYARCMSLVLSLLVFSPPGTKDALLSPSMVESLRPYVQLLHRYGQKRDQGVVSVLRRFWDLLNNAWGTQNELSMVAEANANLPSTVPKHIKRRLGTTATFPIARCVTGLLVMLVFQTLREWPNARGSFCIDVPKSSDRGIRAELAGRAPCRKQPPLKPPLFDLMNEFPDFGTNLRRLAQKEVDVMAFELG